MITEENRNRNGRPKGSVNKVSAELRKSILDLVSQNQNELAIRMNRLDDDAYLKHYTALLRFVLPQLKATMLDFSRSESLDFKSIISQIHFTDESND